jgi:hypothetical protein
MVQGDQTPFLGRMFVPWLRNQINNKALGAMLEPNTRKIQVRRLCSDSRPRSSVQWKDGQLEKYAAVAI